MEEKKNSENLINEINDIWKQELLKLNKKWAVTANRISDEWSALFGKMNKRWCIVSIAIGLGMYALGYIIASL